MPEPKEELKRLLELLKLEEEEDRRQYAERIEKVSLRERVEQGFTWYPIVIKDIYYGMGERLMMDIERPAKQYILHQFQHGCTASLFSNHENYRNEQIKGIVSAVGPYSLKLTLSVDEAPEWVDKGKLGVNMLFDESSYKVMQKAVKEVMAAEHNRLAELRDVLLGEKAPQYSNRVNYDFLSGLNDSQNEAIKNLIAAKDVAIIHGPPGTGKTTTLVAAIKEVLKNEKQILVCAPSNTAVDLLTEKISSAGISVLRIGNPSRVDESVLKYTLDRQIDEHPEKKQIKELKKRAREYKNMALKYKRNFGYEEREQRRLLLNEAKKVHGEAEAIEKFISGDIIDKVKVITATPVGAGNYLMDGKIFSTVMIDEAGQALEPSCWIPILKAEKVFLAGDHCQLSPTVKSDKAAKGGLSETLFEKVIKRQKVSVMLETQYRMNEAIMGFSSSIFYDGKLQAHDSVKKISIGDLPVFEFVDTAGCGYNELFESEGQSMVNKEEADLLMKHFNQFVEDCKNVKQDFSKLSVGVIAPYRAQVNYLKTLFAEQSVFMEGNIQVQTVDSFQGQERDVIYISLTRSNDKNEIGFLNDIRRMNVAMTRAKKKLVMIGDSATLVSNNFYKQLIEYVEREGTYKSAWEYISQ
jgi:ATP-dependent RNA/DNA helicase IGHMBP2